MTEEETFAALKRPTYEDMRELYISISYKPYSQIVAFFAEHGWDYEVFINKWIYSDD